MISDYSENDVILTYKMYSYWLLKQVVRAITTDV
jgi:hypothetical protein